MKIKKAETKAEKFDGQCVSMYTWTSIQMILATLQLQLLKYQERDKIRVECDLNTTIDKQ